MSGDGTGEVRAAMTGGRAGAGSAPAGGNGACLVVEGGGMRGLYTAGVLSCMHGHGVAFPHVIGVSSGALWATAFVAGMVDPDFQGASRALPKRGFVNPVALVRPERGLLRTDALMDAVLTEAVLDAALRGAAELHIPATDALTGELRWRSSREMGGPAELRAWVRASCSIPFVMPKCTVGGRVWADGGIVDSIPVGHARELGCASQVLLLTRLRGYRKPRQHLELYLRAWLAPYPRLRAAMLARHIHYNESMAAAERAEDAGEAFVVRPRLTGLGRFEYDPAKLRAAFEQGREDARPLMGPMRDFVCAR